MAEQAQEDPKEDAPSPQAQTQSNVRHDWYQTETQVVVTILLKNAPKDDVKINAQDNSITVQVAPCDYKLHLELAHSISPEKCKVRVVPSKIEVKLMKVEGVRWQTLERSEESEKMKKLKIAELQKADADVIHHYPSSSHVGKDWDKLVVEIKEEEKNEKPEGDAALQQLFQQIYADGTDETKKAMMKSFSESGGTVLSTNWKEVGNKKVDVKPPDGMEYKKYDQ